MATHKKISKHFKENSDYYMFGLHAVKAAIENPERKKHELWISQNAKAKIFSNFPKKSTNFQNGYQVRCNATGSYRIRNSD